MKKKMYVHDHRGKYARLIDIIYWDPYDITALNRYCIAFGYAPNMCSWTDSLEWTKGNYYDHYSRYNP